MKSDAVIIKKRRTGFLGRRDKIFDEIEKALEKPLSLLDVGCGSDSPVQFFRTRPERLVGVDGFQPSIDKSKIQSIHDDYQCIDLTKLGQSIKPKSFDCVVSIDVIEHFEKTQGLELISDMEKIAQRRVVILTPNGFLEQNEHSGNPYQKHRSGWTLEEFQEMGYEVIGVNGWKPILGAFAQPRFWPAPFWRIISRLSQPFVRYRPEHAFHLLCIKKLD